MLHLCYKIKRGRRKEGERGKEEVKAKRGEEVREGEVRRRSARKEHRESRKGIRNRVS